MLDYKDIITKHYAASWSGAEIARQTGASKSGVNDFLKAFKSCERITYPLPEGITNYGIHELVYGHAPGSNTRNEEYVQPDYEWVFHQMNERKNMTLVYLWGRYSKRCKHIPQRWQQKTENRRIKNIGAGAVKAPARHFLSVFNFFSRSGEVPFFARKFPISINCERCASSSRK